MNVISEVWEPVRDIFNGRLEDNSTDLCNLEARNMEDQNKKIFCGRSIAVVGRVPEVVAHQRSINIGKPSVPEKTVVNDRWSLTTVVAHDRINCTIFK